MTASQWVFQEARPCQKSQNLLANRRAPSLALWPDTMWYNN